MSRIPELAAKIAADKTRADELEASMAHTGEIADQLTGSFRDIGAEGKAAQIQEVKSRLGQARNTRWLAEGHLEDALTVIQAIADGQRDTTTGSTGSPSTDPSTSPSDSTAEPEDGHTFTTELDGHPVQVTLVPAEPEHEPGPSGQQLVEESQDDEKLGSARRLSRQGVRKIEDIQSQVKDTSGVIDKLASRDPAPQQLEAVEIQDVSPGTDAVVTQVPQPPVSWVDAAVQGLTLGIGAIEAATRARRRKNDDR